MNAQTLGLYLLVVFITSITPGAGVLYTLHNAVTYGVKNAVWSPTGNATGVAVMSIIAASGLGAIIHANEVLFYGLQTAGCLLMIYFGWKSWNSPIISLESKVSKLENNSNKNLNDHTSGNNNPWKIFSSAALLQVTNPMLIVFLLSLMPQFIDPNTNYWTQIILLISLFVFICWLVHIFYSYSAALASDRWMSAKFSFWLNKISAILFWLLSGSVLLKLYGAI